MHVDDIKLAGKKQNIDPKRKVLVKEVDLGEPDHVDYWNVDGSRDLSDYWTGFTQFTLLEEKPPDGYMWSGKRSTRKQLTSRPDHLWPELLDEIGKARQAEGEAKVV